ncbi:MAG: HAMP domain-containing histidine kinase [Magnetococcales bacterium]|nr:HAMP domain-containing histidine kinase [Magnetococcales bacterium]
MLPMDDDALIAELKKRFDQTKQALYDLKMVTRKLESVNQKLEASERVKSNFVSHMKNEINNPLTSILGLSQQLTNPTGAGDPELVMAMAKLIHSEAFNLDFQLRNIFIAAELESGEAEMHISMVDVDSLVTESLESFRHLIMEKGLEVRFTREGPADSPLIFKTDAEKLAIIISNFISNAIEFNMPNGRIDIQARVMEGQFNFSVTDTGVGLDPSQVNRIFDRFYQVESGSTKQHKGQGLGLSITKAIIDLLEGSVTVDCPKGCGCTFAISIPEIETNIEAEAFSVDGNEFLFEDEQIEAF